MPSIEKEVEELESSTTCRFTLFGSTKLQVNKTTIQLDSNVEFFLLCLLCCRGREKPLSPAEFNAYWSGRTETNQPNLEGATRSHTSDSALTRAKTSLRKKGLPLMFSANEVSLSLTENVIADVLDLIAFEKAPTEEFAKKVLAIPRGAKLLQGFESRWKSWVPKAQADFKERLAQAQLNAEALIAQSSTEPRNEGGGGTPQSGTFTVQATSVQATSIPVEAAVDPFATYRAALLKQYTAFDLNRDLVPGSEEAQASEYATDLAAVNEARVQRYVLDE